MTERILDVVDVFLAFPPHLAMGYKTQVHTSNGQAASG
jgi:hypothetical protein